MATTQPLPHPGVRFPPPFVYVAGLAAGWLLHRQWPLFITDITGAASRVRDVIAVFCLAGWLGLMLSAMITFRRAHTTLIPHRPATALVMTGPYRFTRNPMYVSLAALYLGVTLVLNTWWPALLLPLVVLVIRRRVIAREERYLASAFPAEYAAYCQRVRRWL